MIRYSRGDECLLITQHDHALISGMLAARWGNEQFMIPEPRQEILTGISLHDAGWPLHDDWPTLNAQGIPLHVFETPPATSVPVWNESVSRAVREGPYAGLLVSL